MLSKKSLISAIVLLSAIIFVTERGDEARAAAIAAEETAARDKG